MVNHVVTGELHVLLEQLHDLVVHSLSSLTEAAHEGVGIETSQQLLHAREEVLTAHDSGLGHQSLSGSGSGPTRS